MRKTDYAELLDEIVLADDWGRLTKYRFKLKLRDGNWQTQTRESYDRGHGVACLLYDDSAGTVLLTRQFRLPVFVSGDDGHLIEAPAGLLEGAEPAQHMRRELAEETGYDVDHLTYLFDLYSSPGSVTEKLSFFIGNYRRADKASAGGGNAAEGEDIEVLHVPFAKALAMIYSGEIRDAKTVILLQQMALRQHR